MPTSNNVAWTLVSSLQDHSLPPHYTTRYAIRSADGYLAAQIPIAVVSNSTAASRFVDMDTARRKAQALIELGWSNLHIVAMRVPLYGGCR